MIDRLGNRVERAFIGGHNIQIGSVAGDIVMVLDRPAYRLELLTPARPGRLPRSQRSPSHLLDAQREVVPYRPRPQDQQALIRWRRDDERVSVLLVHGQGGYGKTRLAGWFATDCYVNEWTVLLAVDKSTLVAPAKSSQPDAAAGRPLLVVVDYADRWPRTTLAHLVDNLVLDYPKQRIRVLLLARPQQGFWNNASALLARSGVDLYDPVSLHPFAPTPAEQQEVFADAVGAFQSVLELHHQPISVPAGLGEDGDTSPLTIHMTALAAVCALQEGTAPPGPKQLSGYLFEHERRYWQAAGLPEEAIERAVFVASLVGPLTAAQARSWLRQAHLADGDAEADRLLTAYERLYPPLSTDVAVQSGDFKIGVRTRALSPLKPDRFAEDFIAECLTQPTANELLAELFTAEAPRELVRRGMIMLAASARHPSARTSLLDLLQVHPELAAHANAAVIELVVQHASPSLAADVHDALPLYNTELVGPARNLAQRLYDSLPADASQQCRARRLSHLGVRRYHAGDKRAALLPAQEAVNIYRSLAKAEPAAFLPDLALTLNNLGNYLIDLRDNRGALRTTQEAVGIFRCLAKAEPAVYLPDLAMSLNNLGNCLSKAGEKRAALLPAQEAVNTYRSLAKAEPTVYLPDLAMSLNNLGIRLAKLGEKRAALLPAQEAVDIHRRLAELEPAAYLPDLAITLNNFGTFLSELGEKHTALKAAQEAVGIYQRLAEVEPAAHLPDLALCLSNLGAYLSELGKKHDSLQPVQEAAGIYRRLVEAEPAAYLPNLATVLNNLGRQLSKLGKTHDALRATQEAVDIRRRLAETEPGIHRSDLAEALSDLGAYLFELGPNQAALTPVLEAVQIYRELANAEPAAYRPDLAQSLLTSALIRSGHGIELTDALAAVNEAIEIYRDLTVESPGDFSQDLRAAEQTQALVLGQRNEQ